MIHQEDQQNVAVKHRTLQPPLTIKQLNLFYSAPIFETSATDLCGTTGICDIKASR